MPVTSAPPDAWNSAFSVSQQALASSGRSPYTAHKHYAPAIGMVQDGALKLGKHGKNEGRSTKALSTTRMVPFSTPG